jgi:hypothetical protein
MAVYFARAETTSFVKIGFAADPERRLLLLQAGCPYRLYLTRVVDGDRRLEAAFHETFAEHRIARDWFHWSDDMALATATPRPAGALSAILRQHLKAERGRLTQLAEALAINPSAISQWEKVPAERVPAVEEATGISRHDLRPDLYGPAPKKKRAA